MKSYPNINHHRNSDGSRLGFDAAGRSWQITGRSGNWTAKANVTRAGCTNLLMGYETLDEVSLELSEIGGQA